MKNEYKNMDLFNKHILPFELPNEEEYSYSYDELIKCFIIKIPNGELLYAEHFFNRKISDRSMDYFLENSDNLNWKQTEWRNFDKDKLKQIPFNNIEWNHDQVRIFGKEVYLPRYSAWYGDNDKPYTYSGLTLTPKPWNEGLLYIKKEIEAVSNTSFNSVLLNWYRDGDDYIGWHTDAEKALGKNPIIGSVNFGAERKFQIRKKSNHKIKINIPLKHGSFLLMREELQHFWQHGVPKEKKINQDRINLTFRTIKNL